MKRARQAVASAVAGQIIKRADDVALVNDKYNLDVHCRKTGVNTSFVTIMVAHRSSLAEGREVMELTQAPPNSSLGLFSTQRSKRRT